MKYLFLLLLAASAKAAPLVGTQDLAPGIVYGSSFTVGNSSLVLNSTANLQAVLIGGEAVVAYTSVTASTNIWFYNLTSTGTWRMEYCLTHSASTGNFGFQINGNVSGVYGSGGECFNTSAENAITRTGTDSQSYIMDVSNGLPSGASVCGNLLLHTAPDAPTVIIVESNLSSTLPGVGNRCTSSYVYSQSQSLSSVGLTVTGGTLKGWAALHYSPFAQSQN